LPEEEEESSNYKELRNLVDRVSKKAMAGRLKDCKLFVSMTIPRREGISTGETLSHPISTPLFWICKP
jgi:hypothetical protein